MYASYGMQDITGTYVSPDNTGGAGGAAGGIEILENIEGQSSPVVMAQIQLGVGSQFVDTVHQAFDNGATGFGFWADLESDPIETLPWWPQLPALAAELTS